MKVSIVYETNFITSMFLIHQHGSWFDKSFIICKRFVKTLIRDQPQVLYISYGLIKQIVVDNALQF